MEFVTDTQDYNVAEFHNMFHDKLPKFVKISQGYCGEIADDAFSKDQVLRIEAVSRQQRVISKMTFKSNQERLISIPASYAENLCVVKNKKVGKETLLQNILMVNHLPLTVRFPKDRSIKVGNSNLNTNSIPSMVLTQTFDEVYLLANVIADGVLFDDVVAIPLYLSQLRLAVITGIKDQPDSQWTTFQENIARSCSYIEYDLWYGNQNIAEYDPSAIHSDSVYSYVEPLVYTNLASLIQRPDYRDVKIEKDSQGNVAQYDYQDNTYEEIGNEAYVRPSTHTSAFANELDSKLKTKRASNNATKPTDQNSKGPPPIAPKPKMAMNDDLAPELPRRRLKQPLHVNTADVPGNQYYNDVPRSVVKPSFPKPDDSESDYQPSRPTEEAPPIVTEQSVATHTVAEQFMATPNVTEQFVATPSMTIQSVATPSVTNADDVSKLTIDEVVACMKRLGLGKYENAFREQLIDGKLLVELDKEMLKDEFGIKGVEALRLKKFVEDGHIPV